MKSIRFKLLTITISTFLYSAAFSQSKKQQQLFEDFVTIVNGYKQLPLQLEVEYRQSDNMTNGVGKVLNGKFYMDKNNAYISFGDMEQIITDSVVLVVMNDVKRMMLTNNTMGISTLLNQSTANISSGKSIKQLSERYHISSYDTSGSMKVISMKSKQLFQGTDISIEEILLMHLPNKSEPYAIVTKKRSLLKKDLVQDINKEVEVISVKGSGEYLLREETATCYFKSIEHDTDAKKPALLSDRIVRTANGGIEVVSAYAAYELSAQ